MPRLAGNEGRMLAVIAECLYLANISMAPILGFAIILWLYYRLPPKGSDLARCHLRQAIAGSIWAGILLILLNAVILLLGGYRSTNTLITLVLYFFTVHSALLLVGMAGLANAMAGKPFVYPLIGRPCHD
ncbi:MAG: hypothetical protein EPO31_09750 [Gammaproteobacteria bacterium]|jgi:uncharacterized Tic20 family protein|nr:MAG: hypothetical protein EPO31_09750 [Gammaproteobacteria bacterium]